MMVTADNLESLAFGNSGLLPAIAQDSVSGEVLMLAWMNREALQQTLLRRRAVFWSRSRQSLWEKGETSGNSLELVSCHADCDKDTLLLLVRPRGPACHEGTLTCFSSTPLLHRRSLNFLDNLQAIIDDRLASSDAGSYTAKLAAAGTKRLAQKVGEEGLETALAAATGDDAELVSEAADLVFHLTVLLRTRGLSLADVTTELAARHAAKS